MATTVFRRARCPPHCVTLGRWHHGGVVYLDDIDVVILVQFLAATDADVLAQELGEINFRGGINVGLDAARGRIHQDIFGTHDTAGLQAALGQHGAVLLDLRDFLLRRLPLLLIGFALFNESGVVVHIRFLGQGLKLDDLFNGGNALVGSLFHRWGQIGLLRKRLEILQETLQVTLQERFLKFAWAMRLEPLRNVHTALD